MTPASAPAVLIPRRFHADSTLTEKQFSQQVVDLARWRGWQVQRTWTSVHSPAGYPDLTMCRPPRLVVVELKTARGKTTPAQDHWLELLSQCPGVETYLWRPSDFDELTRILEGDQP